MGPDPAELRLFASKADDVIHGLAGEQVPNRKIESSGLYYLN
jgi:hypothetical protein